MKAKLICAVVMSFLVASSVAWADSLELKNGSLIKGKFMGGTASEVSFKVGSSVQQYNVSDIVSLKFDSEPADRAMATRPAVTPASDTAVAKEPGVAPTEHVTIPAGTHLFVRTLDGIDSTRNRPGDRFQVSFEEPVTIGGNVVVAKGTDAYGRLAESKTSGTFTGRSELRLELTGIVINGRTVPVVTGEYQLSGKSRGESTAKRTVGGAAVGTLIGALAGGGKGAAIGAGVGGAAGAGSEVITKGDQVKVPSETLLDFTLQQELSIPAPRT